MDDNVDRTPPSCSGQIRTSGAAIGPMGLVYSNNSDGTVWSVGGGLPFYSLEARNDRPVSTSATTTSIVHALPARVRPMTPTMTMIAPRICSSASAAVTDQWTERLLLGWRVDRAVFRRAAESDAAGSAAAGPRICPIRLRACSGSRTTTTRCAISI